MCVCARISYYGLLWCLEASSTCEANLDWVYDREVLAHCIPLRIPSMVLCFVNVLIVIIVGSFVHKVLW